MTDEQIEGFIYERTRLFLPRVAYPAIRELMQPVADVAELEHENRLLRARNERVEALLAGVVPRLESACGAAAMPPRLMRDYLEGRL